MVVEAIVTGAELERGGTEPFCMVVEAIITGAELERGGEGGGSRESKSSISLSSLSASSASWQNSARKRSHDVTRTGHTETDVEDT